MLSIWFFLTTRFTRLQKCCFLKHITTGSSLQLFWASNNMQRSTRRNAPMGDSNKSQALYLAHELRSQSKFLKNDPHRLKIQHAIARCRRTIPLKYLPYDTRFLPIIGKKRSHLLLYPLLRYLMAFKGYSLQMRCFFVGLAE